MRIYKVAILAISVFTFVASMAVAADFYGAIVYDKDPPTTVWKAGIMGVRPIVTDVIYGSPAERAGFSKGDIILSINNKDVKRSSDLDKITGNVLKINMYSGFTWKTLTIDKLAIENKSNRRISEGKAAPVISIQRPYVDEHPDNSPPLKFDDAALESMYGKTTPAELERQRQISRQREREERALEAENIQKEARRIEAEKLAKTKCTGSIPGECGTGRACVYNPFIKGSGECYSQNDADRIVAESKEIQREIRQQQRDWEIDRKLDEANRKADDLKDKADRLERRKRLGL